MGIYGYSRVSSAEQAEGTSLPDQAMRIRGAAMLMGSELIELFTDAGVSGGVRLKDRKQGAALLARLQPGDTLIVSKMDRAFRSASDALATIDQFQSAGIALVVVEIGLDPVTGSGITRLVASILGVVAEFERTLVLERVQAGRATKRSKCGYTGGKRPFGYVVVGAGKAAMLSPHPAEQKAIVLMKSLRRRGFSLTRIAERLRREGHAISHMGVKSVLNRNWPEEGHAK